jgi:antirestriction protein ArdC
LGWHVKKGERDSPVVFWKRLQVEAPGEPDGKEIVPFLRYYPYARKFPRWQAP